MICPKCQNIQSDSNQECDKCGIIFVKYYQAREREKEKRDRKIPLDSTSKNNPINFSHLLFHIKDENNFLFFTGRCVIYAIILCCGVIFILQPYDINHFAGRAMHLIDLPFHEAGHILFRPFGHFLMSLGGTLGQLLMPLICLFVLLLQTRDTFGASVTFWWFGQNFFDIAPYIRDARSLTLPLLGGNVGHSSPYGFHDWEYLLTESGLLQYDHFLAGCSFGMGVVVIILSLLWGGYLLFKQFKELTC